MGYYPYQAYAGGAALVAILFLLLVLTFFGAICFAADDMRRYLRQIAENTGRGSAEP